MSEDSLLKGESALAFLNQKAIDDWKSKKNQDAAAAKQRKLDTAIAKQDAHDAFVNADAKGRLSYDDWKAKKVGQKKAALAQAALTPRTPNSRKSGQPVNPRAKLFEKYRDSEMNMLMDAIISREKKQLDVELTHLMDTLAAASGTSGKMQLPPLDSSRKPKGSPQKVSPAKAEEPMEAPPLAVILAGSPSSGRRTQAAVIAAKSGAVLIDVEKLLTQSVQLESHYGKRAKGYLVTGTLIPDSLLVDMLRERIAQADVQDHGFILADFPRTVTQAKAMEKVALVPSHFVCLDVPDQILIDRAGTKRWDPLTHRVRNLTAQGVP